MNYQIGVVIMYRTDTGNMLFDISTDI